MTSCVQANLAVPRLHDGMASLGGDDKSSAPFVVSPAQIVFEDFEPGCVRHVTATLVNASGRRAACRFLENGMDVADVLQLQLKPPGYLSPGMSCHLHVTFHPKVNEDIHTEIGIITDLGPISVPAHCLRKRAKLSLSSDMIDFGACLTGGCERRTLELHNSGALKVTRAKAFFIQRGHMYPKASLFTCR